MHTSARAAETFPLAPPQEHLWEHMRLLNPENPGATFLNLTTAVRWEGPLDADALDRALRGVVHLHPVLRSVLTGYEWDSGQRPAADATTLTTVDLGGHSTAEAERAARRLALADDDEPFDLRTGPVTRARLVRLSPDDHVLLLAFPFLMTDGTSLITFFTQLHDFYRRVREDSRAELPSSELGYLGWARRQRAEAADPARLQHWRRVIPDTPPPLDLRTDQPRTSVNRFRYEVHDFELPPELLAQLRAMALRRRSSVLAVMLSAYAAILFRRTGQSRLTISTLLNGRTDSETAAMIGYFPNVVFVDFTVTGTALCSDLLARTTGALRQATRQQCSYHRLVEHLEPGRLSAGPCPPFAIGQASLTLGVARRPAPPRPELPYRLRSFGFDRGDLVSQEFSVAADPLRRAVFQRENPSFEVNGGGGSGVVQYNSALFRRETIVKLADDFRTALATVVREPDARVDRLPGE
ncbi:condensation domain-containing protein [Amycolatopsis sp. NPDC003676]